MGQDGTGGRAYGRAMFPTFFRSQRALGALNVFGVGLSLASLAGWLQGAMAMSATDTGPSAVPLFVGTTLFTGTLTAALLRIRSSDPSKIRIGWWLSPVGAWLNAVLGTFGAFLLFDKGTQTLPTLSDLAIVTFYGAIVWVPAWLMSLVLFGLPIAWAQRQARLGLAGEERGERIIGTTVAVLSLVSLLGVLFITPRQLPAVIVVAVLGTVLGALTAAMAWQREQRRKAFVAEAEEGRAPGYRVEATDQGKVLIRVTRPEPEAGYRTPDSIDEEFYALDEQGQDVQPQQA